MVYFVCQRFAHRAIAYPIGRLDVAWAHQAAVATFFAIPASEPAIRLASRGDRGLLALRVCLTALRLASRACSVAQRWAVPFRCGCVQLRFAVSVLKRLAVPRSWAARLPPLRLEGLALLRVRLAKPRAGLVSETVVVHGFLLRFLEQG
ncbi:MAG: hypothetical protein IPJ34_13050 [Myxococcales bacterium]|nr:hypothetical protein [Myxococcales bacterium]